MNKLIFQPFFGGHALEYIQHLYQGCSKNQESTFYFALSDEFYKYKYPTYSNIIFIHLESAKTREISLCANLIKRSYLVNKYLKSIIKQYQIEEVYLITYDYFYPLFPFFTIPNIKYNGIYYFIYLYKWKELPIKNKLYNKILMYLMAKNKSVYNIFICNDSSASAYFNRVFKTNKFKKLVDPYVPLQHSTINIRKEYNIKNKYILLHFGALSARKGTIEILDSIPFIDNIEDYCFIFAGKIDNNIKETFYKKVDFYKSRAKIIVKDEFCTFDYLAALCQSGNLILMPYTETSQSSGMFGYASQFNIPILAPPKGLFRKIIRKYHLGFFLKEITPQSIATSINTIFTNSQSIISSKYIKDNNIQDFTETFFNLQSENT